MAKLADIADLNPPLAASVSDGDDVSFLPMAAVDADSVIAADRETRLYSEVSKGYTPFLDGDVLVAKITPCFENGKIAQARLSRPYGFGSTEFHVVRPRSDRADARYLVHYLRQDRIRKQGESRMTGSAGQRRVPEHFLAGLSVPLPPLHEQRRIAEILDKADALRAKRRAALGLLDTLTQSIFLDMFGDPATNPKGWPWHRLGDVSDFFAGSSLPEGEEFTDQRAGFLLLKVSDMNLPGNEVYLKTSQQWSEGPGAASSTCPAGSVVIPKRGGAIGTNKKRITTRPSILDPNLMAIVPRQGLVELPFLFAWLLRLDLASITSGSSVPQLNKRDLDPLSIFVPPLKLQSDFSQRVAGVEKIIALRRIASVQNDALFASLQQRAFRGEL